jgi:hypothetical protein
MRITPKTVTLALLALGLAPSPVRGGQNPAPPPASASRPSAPAEQAPAAPQPPAVTGLLQQEELTGDWSGLRTRWKDKGVVLDSSLTQFYQAVASGSRRQMEIPRGSAGPVMAAFARSRIEGNTDTEDIHERRRHLAKRVDRTDDRQADHGARGAARNG